MVPRCPLIAAGIDERPLDLGAWLGPDQFDDEDEAAADEPLRCGDIDRRKPLPTNCIPPDVTRDDAVERDAPATERSSTEPAEADRPAAAPPAVPAPVVPPMWRTAAEPKPAPDPRRPANAAGTDGAPANCETAATPPRCVGDTTERCSVAPTNETPLLTVRPALSPVAPVATARLISSDADNRARMRDDVSGRVCDGDVDARPATRESPEFVTVERLALPWAATERRTVVDPPPSDIVERVEADEADIGIFD